jgi:hypothetical protein
MNLARRERVNGVNVTTSWMTLASPATFNKSATSPTALMSGIHMSFEAKECVTPPADRAAAIPESAALTASPIWTRNVKLAAWSAWGVVSAGDVGLSVVGGTTSQSCSANDKPLSRDTHLGSQASPDCHRDCPGNGDCQNRLPWP